MKLLLYLLPLLLFQMAGQLPSGRISGQIRDSAGRATPGIRIYAIPVQTDVVDARTATETINTISLSDANGRYTLEDVPPGRYLIAAGDLSSPVFYPGNTDVKQGRIMTVAAGQPLANVDFTFTFPRGINELWGTAGLDDGTPLSPEMLLQFRFIVSSPQKYWLASPFTRQQGIFFFSGLDLEELAFNVAPLPLGYYLKSATYGNVDLTKTRLNLKGGLNDTQIQIVLTKTPPPGTPIGAKVSGRITGWRPGTLVPLRAVATVLGRATNLSTMVGSVELRDEGAFSIEGVPPGLYMLGPPFDNTFRFDVAGTDINNLELLFDARVVVPVRTESMRSIKFNVHVGDAGDGTVPEFEIRFTATRPNPPAPHAVKVSAREFSALVPEGEYRASISGLPSGYVVVSVTAGPFDISEPFLLSNNGIADRFTGKAISAGITIKLR